MLVILKKVIVIALTLFVVTGCNLFGPSPEDQIYEQLETAVSLENNVDTQQPQLVELEKKEQAIYQDILKLGMSDFEKIKSLSADAIKNAEEREKRIDKEKERLDASREAFNKTKQPIEKIKDKQEKAKAEQLTKLMNERYDDYLALYTHYKEAIQNDKDLYNMFMNEKLTLTELEAQIDKVNQSYEKVMKANQSFNDATNAYNQAKKEFYQLAGLKVKTK